MSDQTLDDGGAAFPSEGEGHGNPKFHSPGMSLRDYFAGQALAGLAANSIEGSHHMPHNMAREAYIIADTMLAIRSAKGSMTSDDATKWVCCGCGSPAPNRVETCDCPTELLFVRDVPKLCTYKVRRGREEKTRNRIANICMALGVGEPQAHCIASKVYDDFIHQD